MDQVCLRWTGPAGELAGRVSSWLWEDEISFLHRLCSFRYSLSLSFSLFLIHPFTNTKPRSKVCLNVCSRLLSVAYVHLMNMRKRTCASADSRLQMVVYITNIWSSAIFLHQISEIIIESDCDSNCRSTQSAGAVGYSDCVSAEG